MTWNTLIAAIAAAGGPAYQYRQIDPVDNQDGGAPGGNIRVGLPVPDRPRAGVRRPAGRHVDQRDRGRRDGRGARLKFSPGRIEPEDPAFTTSRKPLAGEFMWTGKTVSSVANHFNSKGGDDPLFGHFQPPARDTENQRHQQAAIVNGFVRDIHRGRQARATIVVLGDINDFEFSATVDILEGCQLLNLIRRCRERALLVRVRGQLADARPDPGVSRR